MKAAKKIDFGHHRLYQRGRSTKGWIKGDQVENMSQISVGDILVLIEHKKQSESLIVVESVNVEFFSWCYVSHTGKVKKADLLPQAKLVTDLPFNQCYKARRLGAAQSADLVIVPKKPRKPSQPKLKKAA